MSRPAACDLHHGDFASPRDYNLLVPVFSKLVCVLVAMMVLAPSLLACALPGVRMSDEEMACCRHMSDQCGDASMPESHSCCRKTISAQASAFQIKQRDPASLDVVGQVVVPGIFVTPIVDVTAPASGVLVLSESPPGHISVLRI